MFPTLRHFAPTPQSAFPELRAMLLRPVLWATLGGALLWLGANQVGLVASPLYLLDSFWLGLASGLAFLLLWRGQVALAAAFYIAFASQPIIYASQHYGIASPVPALYLLGILLCGLLVGGWFLGMWTLMYALMLLAVGLGELGGQWGPATPITERGALLSLLAFWWVAFGAMGWLVWLFASHLEHAATLTRGQATALTRTLAALGHEPGLESALRQVLATVAELMGARWGTLWLYDPASEQMAAHMVFIEGAVHAAADVAEQLPPPTPVSQLPIWQEMQRTHAPVLITDVANDPRIRFRARAIAEGLRVALHLPLLQGDTLLGSLSLHSTEPRRYRPEELELAQALMQQVTLAMQLAQRGAQAEQAAVIEERNRLAREIHDTLAQGFTGIVIQLEAAEDTLASDPTEAQQHLARARTLARSSLAEARRSVRALRPLALEQATLGEALAQAARGLVAGTVIALHIEQPGPPQPLPAEVERELLRIGQEALTNAVRHAQPQNLWLTLAFQGQSVRLTVRDDGIGFAGQPRPRSDGGFGLQGIRERAAGIGAALHVQSAPGAGTAVVVELAQGK